MSKETTPSTHEPVTKSTTPRSSTCRTIMISLVTCVLILSLCNSKSVSLTINRGIGICKSHVHGQKISEPTNTSLEESSQTSIPSDPEIQPRSTIGKQDSFSLRRLNGDTSGAGSAVPADGWSEYNHREEEDGRSGYNNIEDGRSGYNRREEEDGRSGYNSVTDGRSGYNRREEDGRSGYNKVEDGRSGYNSAEDGRSWYDRAI